MHSLQGLVLGADVETDLPSSDGEGVHGVVLHHHFSILWRSQLDEGLDTHRTKVRFNKVPVVDQDTTWCWDMIVREDLRPPWT